MAPLTLPKMLSPVRNPLPTAGSCRGASGLTVLSIPEAFQVAKDIFSLLFLTTPRGHPPAKAIGSRREQGELGSFPALAALAPSRCKPTMILALWSLTHHQTLEPQHCMEAEVGTVPPWSPRDSSSESEGESFAPPRAHHRYPAYAPPDSSTNCAPPSNLPTKGCATIPQQRDNNCLLPKASQNL